jgi:hypothetical protein
MVPVLAAEHTGATDYTAVVHSSVTPALSSCSTVSSITWGTRGNDAAAGGSDAASRASDDDASDDVTDDVDDDVATAIAKLNAAAVHDAGLPHNSTHQREHHECSDSGGAITAAKHKVQCLCFCCDSFVTTRTMHALIAAYCSSAKQCTTAAADLV